MKVRVMLTPEEMERRVDAETARDLFLKAFEEMVKGGVVRVPEGGRIQLIDELAEMTEQVWSRHLERLSRKLVAHHEHELHRTKKEG